MRINHNIAALNTHRQLGSAQNAQKSSMEKLSSGMRINGAKDDAAGLAISEKMRGQIRGLDQATNNAQDANSMLQTAEGALNETHDILQRMRELATQSANDTNTTADRGEIQKEVDQLAEEITRISNNTEFNTQTLLNGGIDKNNLGDVKFQIGANKDQNLGIEIKAMDASSLGVSRDIASATLSANDDITGVELSGTLGTAIVDGSTLAVTANDTAADTAWAANAAGITGITIDSTTESSTYNGYTIATTTGGAGAPTATLDAGEKTITLTGSADFTDWTDVDINAAFSGAGIGLTATGTTTAIAATTGVANTDDGLAADEVALTIDAETVIVKDTATSATFTSAENKGLTIDLDSGFTAVTATATIAIGTTNSTAATFAADGTTTSAVAAAGIDVSSQSTANTAIETINKAIETVSSERSKIGAVQNRLDHTINNLGTSSENLTAAESRIRDVDYALAA